MKHKEISFGKNKDNLKRLLEKDYPKATSVICKINVAAKQILQEMKVSKKTAIFNISADQLSTSYIEDRPKYPRGVPNKKQI